jgi:hypothetical protein
MRFSRPRATARTVQTQLGLTLFRPVWTRKKIFKLMQPEKNRGAAKVTHNIGNPRRLQRSKREVSVTFTKYYAIRSPMEKRYQKSHDFKIRSAKENNATIISHMYLL